MQNLIESAKNARKKSYSPYSGFSVGAAILTEDGKIYEGANIENASYSLTICAERVALFNAIMNGETKFKAIAIAGGKNDDSEDICPPCGACRQVLSEFCEKDMKVILIGNQEVLETTLGELLPLGFSF